jgi:hypothetical protein
VASPPTKNKTMGLDNKISLELTAAEKTAIVDAI